jgi:Zn2+/Cd2+-exporting ATPase
MSTNTKQQYRLENLSCANCAAKFERNVKNIESVTDAEVNFGASKITVYGHVTKEQIEQAGAFDGIKVNADSRRNDRVKIPIYKRRENILAAISLLFIIMALTLEHVFLLENVAITSYVLAIAIGGLSIFKVGFANLLKFEFDMKTLMTVAIIGAALIGEWKEAAIVVFLFAISEALEAYSMTKARNAITKLMEIAPTTATVTYEIDGQTVDREIATEHIQVGDVLRIKPGKKIAMDGEVIEGSSTVNEASITGESIPVSKVHGNVVYAGTINEQGSLLVRVTKRVEDSTLAKIIHLVEEAQSQKAPSQKFVDRFAKYYTPIIMIVALLVATVPSVITGNWQEWIYQGLAVLVVGCPCALVISTPVAIVTAIGNAARQGVLIKGGAYLEELSRVRIIAFDKTGTLTKGQPEVKYIEGTSSVSENQLIAIVASIEKHSQHPLASSILNEAFKRNIDVKTAQYFQSVTGKGAYGLVNGEKVYVGSSSWIAEFVPINNKFQQKINSWANEGHSIIVAANEHEIIGIISVADSIREDASETIEQLHRNGIGETVMLTGDAELTAHAIAKQLGGIQVYASLLPQEKLQKIEQLKSRAVVAMVGDGINDAPALAKANIGIAMGGAGTDVALETADIALMGDDLTKIAETIKLSKKTLRIIKENITFALGLKLIALLLVVPGWLTLWIAIFADIGATLLVVLNSLRLLKKAS